MAGINGRYVHFYSPIGLENNHKAGDPDKGKTSFVRSMDII